MTTPLPLAPEIASAAAHGSWCPKMCTFACPVATATGLDEAVPWSFHRVVSDLATGRLDPAKGWERLRLCNGCGSCGGACTYDQDVPGQILEARAGLVAAGHLPGDVARAIGNLRSGLTADGRSRIQPKDDEEQQARSIAIVLGLDETDEDLDVLGTLARRAGLEVRFVGGLGPAGPGLRALGRVELASAAEDGLIESLAGATTVVLTDPDMLEVLEGRMPPGCNVQDIPTWLLGLLESGRLRRVAGPGVGRLTWHDPLAMTRPNSTAAARQVLRLLGAVVVEPEGHRTATVAAGLGMAMEILAPEASELTTKVRAEQLAATGAPVITTGAAMRRAFSAVGLQTHELAGVVARRTGGVLSGRKPPSPSTTEADAPTSQD